MGSGTGDPDVTLPGRPRQATNGGVANGRSPGRECEGSNRGVGATGRHTGASYTRNGLDVPEQTTPHLPVSIYTVVGVGTHPSTGTPVDCRTEPRCDLVRTDPVCQTGGSRNQMTGHFTHGWRVSVGLPRDLSRLQ